MTKFTIAGMMACGNGYYLPGGIFVGTMVSAYGLRPDVPPPMSTWSFFGGVIMARLVFWLFLIPNLGSAAFVVLFGYVVENNHPILQAVGAIVCALFPLSLTLPALPWLVEDAARQPRGGQPGRCA